MSCNLPPGVYESDIPGNRLNDILMDAAIEYTDENFAPVCKDNECNCEHALVHRGDSDFASCELGITTLTGGIDIIVMSASVRQNEPSDCPFYQKAIDDLFDRYKEASDNRRCR